MSTSCFETPRQEIEFWMPSRLMGLNYEISDKGRVRSLNYRSTGEIAIMSQTLRRGYPRIAKHEKSFQVHTLVADAFIGPRPEGMQVNHKDGNKQNNRRNNLEYCTPSQNTAHAHRSGLCNQKGDKNNASKLTEENVMRIKAIVRGGLSQTKTAAQFGVSRATVNFIMLGKRWGHVA